MSADAGLLMPELAFETAIEHASMRVPVASPGSRVGDVRGALLGQRFESAGSVAVCEDGRLVGLLSMEELLAAPDDALAADIMDGDPPVVEGGGRSAGLRPPRRLLRVLLWEHDEDMARLGGFMRDTSAARTASEEPVGRRFWHRLPWLLVGLAGAVFAARIVGARWTGLKEHLNPTLLVPGGGF